MKIENGELFFKDRINEFTELADNLETLLC